MLGYGDTEYWNARYDKQGDKTYDWCLNWTDLKEILEKHAIDGLYETYTDNNIE